MFDKVKAKSRDKESVVNKIIKRKTKLRAYDYDQEKNSEDPKSDN